MVFESYTKNIQRLQTIKPHLFDSTPPMTRYAYAKLGEVARNYGVTATHFNVVYSLHPREAPDVESELLPPFHRRRWHQYDGTVNQHNLINRYARIVELDNNSCALDAVLCIGIYSRAAVQQVDAISFAEYRRLTPAQKKFRELMALPWGRMKKEARHSEKEHWMMLIAQEAKSSDDSVQRCQDVEDIVRRSFKDLPSFSFSCTEASWCCGTGPEVYGSHRIQKLTVLSLPYGDTNTTLEDRINSIFLSSQDKQRPAGCGRTGCNKEAQSAKLILDRLPPMLAICLGGDSVEVLKTTQCKLFNDISIGYQGVKGWRKRSYSVDGIIVSIGRNQDCFVTRYKGQGSYENSIIEYNSLKSDRVKRRKSWVDGLATTDCVRVVFYRQDTTTATYRF